MSYLVVTINVRVGHKTPGCLPDICFQNFGSRETPRCNVFYFSFLLPCSILNHFAAKVLPNVTLDIEHTVSTMSTNIYLPSVFLSRTRQMVCRLSNLTLGKKKWFVECFSKIHSAKDYYLPSVFGNYTRKIYFSKEKNNFFLSIPLLFAECFWKLHSANLFSK